MGLSTGLRTCLRIMGVLMMIAALNVKSSASSACSSPPTIASFPSQIPVGGGSGMFSVTPGRMPEPDEEVNCGVSLSSVPFFVTITSFSGSMAGNTFVDFTVPANPGVSPRAGLITLTQSDNTTTTLLISQAGASGNFDVHHDYSFSGNHYDQDLTLLSGGPAAAPGAALTSFFEGGDFPEHVFYLTADNHLHHDYSFDGNHYDQDLTVLSGGPAAAVASALTSFFEGGSFPEHVFYLTADNHLHHDYSFTGNHYDQDLTLLSGGPPAVPGSPLTSFFEGGSFAEHVFYLTADNHIHHDYSDSTGGHHDQDLTALSGGPAAAPGSPLTSFFEGGSSPEHVFYLTPDNHVHHDYSDSTAHTTIRI